MNPRLFVWIVGQGLVCTIATSKERAIELALTELTGPFSESLPSPWYEQRQVRRDRVRAELTAQEPRIIQHGALYLKDAAPLGDNWP